MAALNELLTTDVGLMSLGVIVFVVVIGAYFARFVTRHMREDAEAAARQRR